MNKIKLSVLGLSNSQSQSGAYALILAEENGQRRLPIIIGAFEAQAIALQLEGLHPPRPLTHDLFVNFAKTYKIEILEVDIYRLEEGVFHSIMVCNCEGNKQKIDARTSDAVALALRFKCPVFTTEEIMDKAGITIDFDKKSTEEKKLDKPVSDLSTNSLQELKELLNEAVLSEDYERASVIRDEINRRLPK